MLPYFAPEFYAQQDSIPGILARADVVELLFAERRRRSGVAPHSPARRLLGQTGPGEARTLKNDCHSSREHLKRS